MFRQKAGNGTLYDLEFLENEEGKRIASLGYLAGFDDAAVGIKDWIFKRSISEMSN